MNAPYYFLNLGYSDMKYIKPRLKLAIEYCAIDGKIHFFSRPAIAIQLSDKSGFIEYVCNIMDGEKDFETLKNILSLKFPNEANYLENLLTCLDNEYLLEDKAKNYPSQLSNYDEVRWSKNIEFFASYCKANENKYAYQEKIKLTKIVVFGLGGVGSNILLNLVAMGFCNITAVDFDKV